MMFAMLTCVAVLGMAVATCRASAAEYEVGKRFGVVYAMHDRTKLVGDLYLPNKRSRAPLLIAMHGGGWRGGGRGFYKYWGPFLAGHGYALFTIEYRLGKSGAYPAAVYDAKAAIQFMRANAAEFGVDPDRIGLMGDSAGGYLAAMLALAGGRFAERYRDDANAGTPVNVGAVVGFYGIYDMAAQWKQDMRVTPGDSITQDFLGVSPSRNPQIYRESSPLSYVTADHKDVRFLLIHGDRDNLVDPSTQSGAFNAALTQAGFVSRLILVPGAAHFWASDPFEKDSRSFGAIVAPQLLQFLEGSL
jgi:acetyl esterase/lipase